MAWLNRWTSMGAYMRALQGAAWIGLVCLLGCTSAPSEGNVGPGQVPSKPPTTGAQANPGPVSGQSSPKAQPENPKAYTGFEQKDVPPDFNLKILANGTGMLSLRSLVGPENQSKVDGVIVAFTASWCGRCKASYPTLEALQKQYEGRLKILLLTAEKEAEGRAKMVEVAKQEKLTLPLLEAPPELVDLWLGEAQNIPRFYLIDYKGMLRVKDTGFGSKMEKLLPNQVEFLLARRAYELSNPTKG